MNEPKDYFEAAQERATQARFFFDIPQDEAERTLNDKRYALVIYSAGLAVESMLRAYRLKIDDSFEGRHNLETLFAESGLDTRLREHLETASVDPNEIDEQVRELRAAINVVAGIWRNAYRYASDRVLVKDLFDRKIIRRNQNKGDKASLLRVQARMLLDAATVIIRAGELAWT